MTSAVRTNRARGFVGSSVFFVREHGNAVLAEHAVEHAAVLVLVAAEHGDLPVARRPSSRTRRWICAAAYSASWNGSDARWSATPSGTPE